MTSAPLPAPPMQRFLEASDRAGRRRKPDGKGGWDVSCPGPSHDHGDRKMRLHVSEGADGRALVYCHVGCHTDDILQRLGLAKRDLYTDDGRREVVPLRTQRSRNVAEPTGRSRLAATGGSAASPAVEVAQQESCDLSGCAALRNGTDLGHCVAQYLYRDASGNVVGQVHRYDPKTFRPFTLDSRGAWKAGGRIDVPYRLPELLEVLAAGGHVVIVEGEKDADALASLDHQSVAATCNAGGAGKWTAAHSQALADAIGSGDVFIVGDTDAAGQEHARKVRESLASVGIVATVEWPTRGKDIAEHLANGGTLADLRPDDTAEVEPSSWEPLDVASYLDGTHVPEVAELLPRTDGVCLLYAGRLHSLHGESESGKSMVALAEVARLLAAGKRVLVLDFESDARTVVSRVVALGAPAAAIRERLRYVRPQEPPTDAAGREALDALLSERYALAVIDGVTDALGMFGTSSLDLDEVSRFMREFPRRIARETGAATVLIDHVTKSSDTRGRFAIGSQAKLNALDGAAYVVEIGKPLGLGMRGSVKLRIAKDRPGSIRPACGPYRSGDRTQIAAEVTFDATGNDGRTLVTVEPPTSLIGQEPREAAPFRPTTLMERASEHLAQQSEPTTTSHLCELIGGRKENALLAVDALVAEGFVHQVAGPRGAKLLTLARQYRQADDPKSDRYAGNPGLGSPISMPEPIEQPNPTEQTGLLDLDTRADDGDGLPIQPADYGPCAQCGKQMPRYGPHSIGSLCEDCRPTAAG